ncbi:MAG TPA: DUF885 domain-containing protein [Streptosporangiaceae bacterium]|nr:DUF885 domain-containing protein [Streptosporangiaceae bacterium]
MPDTNAPRAVRDVADAYVFSLAELNPLIATRLGLRRDEDRLPDLSPAGQQAKDELARFTLERLGSAERAARSGSVAGSGPGAGPGSGPAAGTAAGDERRCARLLRERLASALSLSEQGEHLRALSNIFGPVQQVRGVFMMMPTATEDDWAVVARRMARVAQALDGYRASLAEGARRGLLAAPRQVRTVVGQLEEWLATADGRGWFADFAAGARVPPALRARLDEAAVAATASIADLRHWLATEYLHCAQGVPDGVGAERYRLCARRWTGADVDPRDAYAWGWSEYRSLREEMQSEARRVLPGASTLGAMRHLDEDSEAVDGVEEIRLRLQQMMDDAIAGLDGSHFDLADRLKIVEARIAPPGSAAAPYYTPPSQDFSRPGQTWLPTLGRTRFPLWRLVSTWYHEGVPGHHLQLGQWMHLSERLSMYQTSVGGVSACTEGWALYAERLMDELGYLSGPGARLGYLDAQIIRAIRVVIDIGMHLELRVPGDSPLGAGETWTADLARAFFAAHSGREAAFVDSEIVRYLGAPGQAISYKLGERAWLAGRTAARAARGDSFDLKPWHMAALSLGSLGLDDLTEELASL